MESSNSPNKAIIAAIVVVLLVATATAAIILSNQNPASDNTATDLPSPSPSTNAPSNNATTTSFKDGTYSATGSYQTPGGQESVGVRVTLADGVITEAEVTEQGKTGEAQEFQGKFVSGFKSQVVGKKIDEVSLSRVAGSSLTSGGFNSAIDDIEKQAQA